jgi:hypothetical protein
LILDFCGDSLWLKTFAQKIRFWKAVALLVAAFVVYIMYLNIAGYQLKASSQHRQQKPESHSDSSQKEPASSRTSQNSQQKTQIEEPSRKQPPKPQSAGSTQYPEKLKAVILKSIPHDTGAFTQVAKKS